MHKELIDPSFYFDKFKYVLLKDFLKVEKHLKKNLNPTGDKMKFG